MEFFAETASRLRDSDLHRHLRVDNLPQWCASIEKVLSHEGEKGDIYCVWGQFRVRREVIRNGVRFTLPTCPNALQWSITAEAAGMVRVHCTLNQSDLDPDFVESVASFVADWKAGIEAGAGLSGPRPVGECPPWYG